MTSRLCRITSLMLMLIPAAFAQFTGDVLGSHNLSMSGTSPVKANMDPCLFCHAPHSGTQGGNAALWSQTLSTQTYTTYTSTTMHNTPQQPTLGGPTSLCLSCHDGTVAVGQTQPYGRISTQGTMTLGDVFGNNLQGSHPVSLKLPLNDSPDLVASLTTTHTTADPLGKVTLVGNNVECTSCHEPHVQAIDQVAWNFLVRDNSGGQLCLSCHQGNARTVNTQSNPLAVWPTSIHAQAVNKISLGANLGSYSNVMQDACLSCHMPHNSTAGPRLLRGPAAPLPNLDSVTQNCSNCHSGGSNIAPALTNIYSEFNKIAHPYPSGTSTHDAGEAVLLNNNRHTTCVDCHSPHSALAVTSFTSPAAPLVRGSQTGMAGISSTDGTTVVNPVVNQYETCLRCHGTSSGKQVLAVFGYLPVWAVAAADPLNIIPQFSATSTSSHPVLHDRSSAYSQPSLLSYMWSLDGKTPNRAMGTRIYCTDCHNSDDNREFGGTGPTGPHGSQYLHILERRYEFSQVAPAPAGGPGSTILNLFPSPSLDPSAGGPYTLCSKCHDLNSIISNASFSEHARHINDGFSCSTCHNAHGMGATSANISGERMVNFDINVVAPNGTNPIAYSRATNSCSLVCHNHPHQLAVAAAKTGTIKKSQK